MKLYGKKEALSRLEKFVSSGRIPHALLITGDEGAGKRTLADYTAMLMMCGQNAKMPCMTCRNCTHIKEHIHPDVVYVLREMPIPDKKDGKESAPQRYSASALREFLLDCYKAPVESKLRICIFEQAETMNEHCQNALLKMIEEPLPFNRYIFLTSDKKAILETILSRVVEIPAGMPSLQECAGALTEKGIDPEQALSLANTFGGNIGRCLAASGESRTAELLKLAEDITAKLCDGKEYDCLALMKGIKDRNELTELLRNMSDIFGNAVITAVKGRHYGFSPDVATKIVLTYPVKKINYIYETILGLLRSMDFNPSVQLTTAVCCARMFEAAEKE